ncbi:hypothetical protein [Alkalibacillus haloalkaliphilus]|uniref:Uncharacterized protein n=1 Tax=Alkalibacillus haloalkaliphilus TaxID=94136 RepID=A0A511W334_9BACI|nr:hypothetical protein [Alkalibacillus haloalkaliphilus]GEN45489.1 hypothetical protein AHA02nite_12650 [Alkalibacillus haloalkaliphilus]
MTIKPVKLSQDMFFSTLIVLFALIWSSTSRYSIDLFEPIYQLIPYSILHLVSFILFFALFIIVITLAFMKREEVKGSILFIELITSLKYIGLLVLISILGAFLQWLAPIVIWLSLMTAFRLFRSIQALETIVQNKGE